MLTYAKDLIERSICRIYAAHSYFLANDTNGRPIGGFHEEH